MAFGGRFLANFALTDPALPCVRVTLPQITRKFDFAVCPGTAVLFLACKKIKLIFSTIDVFKICMQIRSTFAIHSQPRLLELRGTVSAKILFAIEIHAASTKKVWAGKKCSKFHTLLKHVHYLNYWISDRSPFFFLVLWFLSANKNIDGHFSNPEPWMNFYLQGYPHCFYILRCGWPCIWKKL